MLAKVLITAWRVFSREQRYRSCRGGKSGPRPPAPAWCLSPLAPFLPLQETVGEHDDGGMTVKAGPQAPLVFIPAQQLFGALVKLFNVKAAMNPLDHGRQWRGLGKVGEVVFPVALLTPGWSFADQPAQLLAYPSHGAIGPDEYMIIFV